MMIKTMSPLLFLLAMLVMTQGLNTKAYLRSHKSNNDGLSDLEKNPQDYRVLESGDPSLSNQSSVTKKYSKDDKAYYPQEPNKGQLADNEPLKVFDTKALSDYEGYTDKKKEDRAQRYPINRKDPLAYYDPMVGQTVVKPNSGLFVTGVDIKNGLEKEQRREPSNEKYYYNAANVDQAKEDPFKKALEDAKQEKERPKAKRYEQFVQEQKDKETKNNDLLKSHSNNEGMSSQHANRLGKVRDNAHTNEQLKGENLGNKKSLYYDSSA